MSTPTTVSPNPPRRSPDVPRGAIALFFTFLFLSISSHAQYVIEPSPTPAGGSRLCFLSPSEGFSIGTNTIRHTSDSGRSWRIITVDVMRATDCDGVMGGTFLDSSTGWILTHKFYTGTDSTFIYKTTDGGATWMRQHASPVSATRYASHTYSALRFVDADNGWVVGKGIIERTTDGGNTWKTQLLWPENQSNSDLLNCAYFRTKSEGWVGGFGSSILHTSDGGATWETQHLDSSGHDGIIDRVDYYYLYDIHFADPLNGIAATGNGNFLYTHDGGRTWSEGRTGYPNDNVKVVMKSPGEIWMIGGDYCDHTGCYSGQSVFHSTDGGASWRSLLNTTDGPTGLGTQFRSLYFATPRLAYLSNDRGEFFRIRDTTTVTVAAVDPWEAGSDLLEVYPNPVAGDLHITGAKPGASLNLYDPLGRRVRTATPDASRRSTIATSGLEAGSYTLEMLTEKGGVRRRIVVVR